MKSIQSFILPTSIARHLLCFGHCLLAFTYTQQRERDRPGTTAKLPGTTPRPPIHSQCLPAPNHPPSGIGRSNAETHKARQSPAKQSPHCHWSGNERRAVYASQRCRCPVDWGTSETMGGMPCLLAGMHGTKNECEATGLNLAQKDIGGAKRELTSLFQRAADVYAGKRYQQNRRNLEDCFFLFCCLPNLRR